MATVFKTVVNARDKNHLIEEMDKIKGINESLLNNKYTKVTVETDEDIDKIHYNGDDIIVIVKISRKR